MTTTTPHPTDPAFAASYGDAWTHHPDVLLTYFAPDATYTDVAMGAEYEGHDEIGRFHRFMLRFAPDTEIEYTECHAFDGRLYAPWIWRGTVAGPLRLRSGDLVDVTGVRFSVPGIAACAYGADGKLTSHQDFWDLATVLDQAGVTIGNR
jgi:steroid delta-isomerase-like uncharacterized protein